MMPTMRTTVTLDQDVVRMLREVMHRSRKSFKEALNDTLRAGFGAPVTQRQRKPFTVEPRSMGLRPGIDPAGLNKLIDELDAEAFIEQHQHLQHRDHP